MQTIVSAVLETSSWQSSNEPFCAFSVMGMLAGGLAVGVEASGVGGEPEGVSGDTKPLGLVDMMVGSGYRWRPGKGEGCKIFY